MYKRKREYDGIPRPVKKRVKYEGLDAYQKLQRLGEGTYGVVYQAKNRNNAQIVALKKVRHLSDKEKKGDGSGFPITSMREIKVLMNISHPNIVHLIEVVMSKQRNVFLVFDYYEHDLASLMNQMKRGFSVSETKCILKQLLTGLAHAHRHFILHRDIKLSNLLLNNEGRLAIADWGLARTFSHPLENYTHNVVSLPYRAPELLFGCETYHTAIDMWSVGCIAGELLLHDRLLQGRSELEQVEKIIELFGAPNDHLWPGFSRLKLVKEKKYKTIIDRGKRYDGLEAKFEGKTKECVDLIKKLMAYDPSQRISAQDAMQHNAFTSKPLPQDRRLMPSFPPDHAQKYL